MDYQAVAANVIEQARAAGADADAYIVIGKQTTIQVAKGEVEKFSYAGAKGIGIRVIKNGQMGLAYTSDFNPESIAATTVAALALAEAVDGDPNRQIPAPQTIPDEDLKIYDPAMADVPAEEKVAFALAVEAAALAADERIQLALRTTYSDGINTVYLANSKGFAGSYVSSYCASYTQAMAVDDDDRTMAFGIGVGVSIYDLDAAKIGREAGEKAAKLLGGKPVPTQKASIVYSPFAAAGLIGNLAQALTAEAMQRNRTFLHGKMGQDVAADVVTLLDNGRLPGGMATRPFDDEGTPTSATRLIDEGTLQAVLYDSYTANHDGTNSTGNASRNSHRTTPSLSPTNFYLQPGRVSPDELIAGVERGLYVVNTMNTHAINPVTGDYSVSAQGFWIEDGKLTNPVNNVTIALPLDELLFNVKEVANDLLFLPFGGAIGSPTFRVDGVTIGGTDA